MKAPVCTDCHTAHAILQPTEAAFRMQSTPICGSCHKDKFALIAIRSTRNWARWAAMWRRRAAGTATGRTTFCLPPIRTRRCNQANLVTTCGKCHAGANLSFVQYQPHANARDRKLNPALYFVRLFMNLLLAGVLTFFVIHTILWLIRARYDQVQEELLKEEDTMPEFREAAVTRPGSTAARKPERFFMRFTRAQRYMHAVLFTHISRAGGHRTAAALQREHLGAPAGQRRGWIRRHSLLSQVLRHGADDRVSDSREGDLHARHREPREGRLLGRRPRWWRTGRT